MPMKKCLLIFLLSASCYSLFAQQFRVSGAVADSADNSPLPGVNVILTDVRDSTRMHGTVTNTDGQFRFTNVTPGQFILRLSYTGYGKTDQKIFVRSSDVDLGVLQIAPSATLLKDVVIQGDPIAVEQKEDTISYNANAYKTNPDATAEDLIAKMPGITNDDSGIKAQGETVRQVLVDGK